MTGIGKTELRLPPHMFERPHRLNAGSAWHRHIPFAFWLVSVAQPRRLVELGTHWGDSYFAFCQAAHSGNVSMEAFAVDTWRGDEHAGLYGEEVYEEVRQWNDLHYGEFSVLLRMLFDDAVREFEDNSIDVLHIDGLHTYEAVRHDFDTWLPKLSNRGIVLFHDTEERERGFGVHRLWDELTEQYPSFGFRYGHGLGVTLVGPDAPHLLLELADSNHFEEPLAGVESLFEALGDRVALMSEIRELTDRFEARIDEMQNDRGGLVAHLEALEAERSKLESALEALEGERSKLESALEALEGERSKLESYVTVLDFERDDARRRLAAVSEELADERAFGLRRWAVEHPWADRLRIAVPQRWGLLDRAMKGRW